jgi:hypothetical protein
MSPIVPGYIFLYIQMYFYMYIYIYIYIHIYRDTYIYVWGEPSTSPIVHYSCHIDWIYVFYVGHVDGIDYETFSIL